MNEHDSIHAHHMEQLKRLHTTLASTIEKLTQCEYLVGLCLTTNRQKEDLNSLLVKLRTELVESYVAYKAILDLGIWRQREISGLQETT